MSAAAPGPYGAVRGRVGMVAARPHILFVGLVVGLLVGLVLTGVQVAVAHTEVEFTLPTDGAVVGESVREITVGFDDPVTLIGPGFEVIDPQENILTPFVATDDDLVFRLQIDPPMGGGDAAVRYEVRAEDGHTISGEFSFTILADAPITTTATTTTTAPATTTSTPAPATDPAPEPTTPAVATLAPAATSPPATEPGTTVGEATAVAAPTATDDEGSSTGTYLVIAAAAAAAVVAVIAGAFVAFRSRANAT